MTDSLTEGTQQALYLYDVVAGAALVAKIVVIIEGVTG